MKFQIVNSPEEFRPTTTIPFQYLNSLSSFAKPVVLRSAPVNILYQERAIKGCTLRDMVLYVKEAVTLLATIGNPMACIHCMQKGEIDVQLNGLDKITLKEGEYNILQMNTDEHTIILKPGVYELQRYDYRRRIIGTDGKPEWMEKLSNNESAICESNVMGEDLIKRQQELKHTSIITEEQEEWFYKKMRRFLLVILESSNSFPPKENILK
jgi:hypothetical protein